MRFGLIKFLLLALMLAAVQALAITGKRLTVEGVKGSALLPALEQDKGEWLSLKDAVLFAGAKITWKSTPRIVAVEYGGTEYRMLIEHPFLYVHRSRRVALQHGLQWRNGELLLSAADLSLLLKEMAVPQAALISASEADLKAALPQAAPQNEPKIETQRQEEPVVVPKGPKAPERSGSSSVKKVVIDPGHGGKDGGAVGRRKTKEKDMCLDIGKRLKRFIEKHEPSIKVVMTRDGDEYVSLQKRTQIANDSSADLFISIHNNAASDKRARGTQVFFYDSQASNKHAARLAHSENADANMLDVIFTDLLKTQVREDSIELAASVQKDLASVLQLKSRRLHYAPFYVLAQTKMPSVLVEAAFISNPEEENLLRTSAFREQVALGIFRGIRRYKKEIESR